MSNLPVYAPAPLRPRKDGWTPARQWEFLQALGDTASVAEAARLVGMSEAAAHRLRRHPEAEDFRLAWDAAVLRGWERVEAAALERVVNGEVEVIERGGEVVATRRRPCSERLMIHMLQQRLRRLELDAEARAAERAEAAAEAAARARGERVKWATGTAAQATLAGLAAELVAADTLALRAEQARAARLPDRSGWVLRAESLDGPAPLLPMPERVLAPADGRIESRGRAPGVRDPAVVAARVEKRAAARTARTAALDAEAEARMAAEVDAWVAAEAAGWIVSNEPSGADLPPDRIRWRPAQDGDWPPPRPAAGAAVRSL